MCCNLTGWHSRVCVSDLRFGFRCDFDGERGKYLYRYNDCRVGNGTDRTPVGLRAQRIDKGASRGRTGQAWLCAAASDDCQ
ncbi:Uncharacterised protein [Bordetella pertussis]|nr:Uncharacterised protein [Bordetella pertussis]